LHICGFAVVESAIEFSFDSAADEVVHGPALKVGGQRRIIDDAVETGLIDRTQVGRNPDAVVFEILAVGIG